jgi:hypothetical protein
MPSRSNNNAELKRRRLPRTAQRRVRQTRRGGKSSIRALSGIAFWVKTSSSERSTSSTHDLPLTLRSSRTQAIGPSKMAIMRPQNIPPRPSRAIICLHDSGSSESIFRVQLARLRLALKDEFEFIFATAPIPSIVGPGMLPLFCIRACNVGIIQDDGGRRMI